MTNAPFGPRYGYRVVAYNNRLWLIGGNSSNGYKNDVWSSADGITWNQAAATTALPARTFGPAVALGNAICVYGTSDSASLHDAYCSSDGITWEKKSDDAPYGPLAVLNGTVFAVGNSAARIEESDFVWKSVDGISWRLGYQNTMRFP